MKRKNILIFTADQLRADALGCYGNPCCRTPHIDRLAAQGVVFDNAFTPNPICVPARASITTGNYPHRATGTKNNGGLIRSDQPRLAAHFAAHGYRTYACGKLHYAPYSAPGQPRLVHGFHSWDSMESGRILFRFDPRGEQEGLEDYFDYLRTVGWGGYSRAHGVGNNDIRPCPSPLPEEHHSDAWVASKSIERLQQHKRTHADKPFLIWCSFPKPHAPLDPPFNYARLYDPRAVPAPVSDETALDDKEPNLLRTWTTHALDSLGPEARRVCKAYYYGLISFQDAQIGRVLDALEASGEAENTVIVYCADHGDLMGDFGMFFKTSFLKGALNIPLLIAVPGGTAGAHRQQLVGLQDILPTIAAATGCPLEEAVQGIDLAGAMNDAQATVRNLYYSQCFDAPRQMAMVTDGVWKYSYAQEGPTEELYHLVEDPNECHNLAHNAARGEILIAMRRALIREAIRLGDTAILDPSTPTGLPVTVVNRKEIRSLPIQGMGWLWY